jgi:hypothetical protein
VFCADHSRIIATLPEGVEDHAVAPGVNITRQSVYEARTHTCRQSWVGPGFTGEETYWFPDLNFLDNMAAHSGLELYERWEWRPNSPVPFLPLQKTSERLLTVYRKQ